MGEVRAGRSEFVRKEGDVSRDGKIEVGGEGWFTTMEEQGGDGKGVIRLWLRN